MWRKEKTIVKIEGRVKKEYCPFRGSILAEESTFDGCKVAIFIFKDANWIGWAVVFLMFQGRLG